MEPVQTLDYGTPPPHAQSIHETIYNTLLLVTAFFVFLYCMLLTFAVYGLMSWFYVIQLGLFGTYLVFIFITVLVRLRFPRYRRPITLALNIALLIIFPFGTALAIYGLLKVDKQSRSLPNDNG